MKTFDGYVFSKLDRIGTRSEGPEYFLQQWDDQWNTMDTPIIKNSKMHQADSTLHNYLAQKVTISGALKGDKIKYEEIKKL